ncbi:MAG TPA: TlpA disulfide reductase family protein [Myxococcales bacterium]|jgi:thiol-disulfide isomerase/thioredoxin
MSNAYSGIPINEKRTWVVPRWLKEAFVAFALVSVAGLFVSKSVQHYGGRLERAKSSIEADDTDAHEGAISLPARGGGQLDLSAFKGKTVLVNFWATWCPPCREEMPSLTRLAQSFDPKTFEVVTVSVDDGWAPVEKFLGKSVPFRVALDEGAVVSRIWGTSKFPESYLVDKEGKVRLKFVGPRDWMNPNVAVVLESFGAKPKA